jgi:1,4-alpha-glucan branching enzyme
MGGNHFTWDNADTHWVWPVIHQAEAEMERLVARYPDPDQATMDVLNQSARELLLLQSSDWPFLITTGQAGEYAIERFNAHVDRFNQLTQTVAHAPANQIAQSLAAGLYERDKLFPDIDYRDWGGT